MVFKHLLLGLGGSAAIGGIGYGIYSSSQFYEKENTKDAQGTVDLGGNLSDPNSKGTSRDQDNKNGGSVQQTAETEKDGREQGQGGDDSKQEDSNLEESPKTPGQTSPGNTSSQSETSPTENGVPHSQ